MLPRVGCFPRARQKTPEVLNVYVAEHPCWQRAGPSWTNFWAVVYRTAPECGGLSSRHISAARRVGQLPKSRPSGFWRSALTTSTPRRSCSRAPIACVAATAAAINTIRTFRRFRCSVFAERAKPSSHRPIGRPAAPWARVFSAADRTRPPFGDVDRGQAKVTLPARPDRQSQKRYRCIGIRPHRPERD